MNETAAFDWFKKIGVILMKDDWPDRGKMDRIHHFHIGQPFYYGSDVLKGCVALSELSKPIREELLAELSVLETKVRCI